MKKSVFRLLMPIFMLLLFVLPNELANAKTAVCKVGDKTYSSIEEALMDIKTSGTGTITMIADYTFTKCLYVYDMDVTLDLAGCKVDCPDSDDYTSLIVGDNGTLRLIDSIGGGSYSSGNDYYGMISVFGGTFIMDSGLIKENSKPGLNETGIFMYFGNVIINGGEIHARFPFKAYCKYESSSLTINGGKFIGVTNSVIYDGVKARIHGGYFKCTDRGLSYWPKADVEDDIQITGGEFHGEEAGIYLINAIYCNKVTLENYQSLIIPYGYQLVSMANPNKVATATEYLKGIFTEKDVKVQGIQTTLSFNSNGGSKVKDKVITYGSTYGTLPVPTRSGYTFLGWYTSATGGTKITADTKVTTVNNQTLYAQWKKNVTPVKTVTLSFNANGGKKLSKKSKVVTYGKKIGTLPTVVRSKYTFAGWYTKKSGGTKVTADKVSTFTKNTTLYAQWKKVTVKKQSIQSVTSKKGKVTLLIKSGEKVNGYEIVVAKNKKFTSGVKKFSVTKTKYTISSLKKRKTYYVKVRAYKYDSAKKKIYGSWSAIKKVVVK